MGKNKLFSPKFILICLFVGISGWFTKAVLDSLILYDKPFFDVLLFDISIAEFIIRIFVGFCFFVAGLIYYNNLLLRKKAQYDLKKANDKLAELNKDLNKKVDERTADVNRLLEDKNRLIINLGHDLRTPLTPFMSLMPIILEREKDPELKKFLDLLNENIHCMRNMVSKTIEIARYDGDLVDLDLKETNLYSEVEKVVEKNRFYLEENEIFVDNFVDKDIVVNIDNLRFRDVLNNLIDNAVKFKNVDKEGLVVIKADDEKDKVVVSVEDNGQGLSKEDLDHVFDELYKSDKSRHDLKSNGLGLSICKRIIEKHGGRIWVESKGENNGCIFYFIITKNKDG